MPNRYVSTGRDNFHFGKSTSEGCAPNREQWRSAADPQLQFNATLTPAACQRVYYSMVLSAQLSPEQTARREHLQRLLQELNIDSVGAPDAVKHDVIEIVSRRVDAFALDDNDIGHTTLVEHRIETGNSIRFRQGARPIPYARRKFVEEELQRLTVLGVI